MKYLKYLILTCMLITLPSCVICDVSNDVNNIIHEKEGRTVVVDGVPCGPYGAEYSHLSDKELEELVRVELEYYIEMNK